MFQTDLILWLQANGSPALTFLLTAVTLLGYTPAYVVVLLVLAFGVRMRPSLAVLTTLLLGAILFDALKSGFALPRPDDLDDRVRKGAVAEPAVLVPRGGAEGFWSLPRPEAVAAARAQPRHNYGFPSGHVAAATAFLLGVARFLRSRRALAFAAVWVPLMALSRLYLGRHFLADVLGGAFVGGLAFAGAGVLLSRLDDAAFDGRRLRALDRLGVTAVVLLTAVPLVPGLNAVYAGGFAGVVATYALLLRGGTPSDEGTPGQRFARVLVALSVCGLTSLTASALLATMGAEESRIGQALSTVLVTLAVLAGSLAATRKLGLHARS